ncbi:outer membrane beta-barrel family protein [Pedobacter soli]|uniref:Outer membrane protein beta-barrel family protein n=1 Tax=Pedobacter soli TaxID=390242 RepID=A0A1G6I5Z6_9SPHI|nr:outer membrane beta-barrel family protein [Pedobacter soli]SDC01186.1 Outer membrane protein beta-barrel family protein [Pedobacter soli]
MGTILSLDVDYFKYIEDQDRDFRTETVFVDGTSGHNLSVYNNTSNQNINNYSFKADMVQPVKKIILNYGGRVSFINNQNAVSFFDLKSGKPVIDPLKSDQFNYKENIQALYFSASHKLANNKWSFKLGLRFENTNTKGVSQTLATTNKNNYSKFFPTAYVNYAPDKDNTFSLSYGKRIRRPRFWEINPFRWYVNDYTYSEGNPFLQPSYSDNYEFNYLYKGNLTAIAFLNVTDNGFGQIPSVDPSTNILALTRQNYFTKYNYGLGMVYSISSLAWLNSFFHSQIYYSDTKFNQDVGSALIGKEQNGFAYTFSNNTTLIFNKDKTLLGELNFWYLSPKKSGLYKEESAYSLSLGVKALFLKKNLQLGVNYYDIFKTSNPDMTTFYNNGTTRIANVYYDNRYLKVSAAYSFGNKKIKSIDRQTGNQEEKNRL